MPAAAYNVSNREEDKSRGRDQSFRNCIVTMFIFIMLCVIIILATIPWRNSSLRRNSDSNKYHASDNPNTDKQFKKEEKPTDKSVLEHSTIPSTQLKNITTVYVAPSIIGREIESTSTIITQKFIPSRPSTRQDIEKSTTTTQSNVETSSTNTHEPIKPSSTTARNTIKISSQTIWNRFELSTAIDKDFRASETTPQNIIPLLTTTQSDIETSSEKIRNNDGISTTINNKNIGTILTTPRNIGSSSTTSQNNDETSSEENWDNTGIQKAITDNKMTRLWTSPWNSGTRSTTVEDSAITSSETIQDNVGNSSTLIDKDTNVLSSTTESKIWIWNRIQNNIGTSSEKIEDNVQTSPATNEIIVPSSTTIPNKTEILKFTSVSESEPTVPTSTIFFLQTEMPDETISSSASDSSRSSTQSFVGIKSPLVSSSISTASPVTDDTGFFYTEETEKSSVTSSTESSIDISSNTEELTGSSEYSTTDSETLNLSGKKVTAGKDGRFPSLETLLVSTFYRNTSNISVTEIDLDWLGEFENITTPIDENIYTRKLDRILSASTQSEKHRAETSITKVFKTETVIETTTKISTNEDENETATQISSDENPNATTTKIYTNEKQIQSTPNTLDQVTDDSKKENKNTTNEVCISGPCKQFASRIISYMNHSADPCQDFYEYACGGMEADRKINNMDLTDLAIDRIKNQLIKSKNNEYSSFKNYYNSCVKYYQETTQEEKIEKARKMMMDIKDIYTGNPSNPGMTYIFAYMMLHNTPLLFDIVTDIDEKHPENFILRLGPVIDNSPLHNYEKNSCSIEDDEILPDEIDLKQLHENYENCKNMDKDRSQSISQIFRIFDVPHYSNGTIVESEYTYEIVSQIDHQISQILSNYPRISQIHASYESKNYSIMTLSALQNEIKTIYWHQLIYTVTNRNLSSNIELQIYLKDDLVKVLKGLESFGEWHEIYDALFWLHARNLYKQFVKPKPFGYSEEQCFHIAMNYLPNDASRLYFSSFTETEINFMNSKINQVFINLKETLRLKFELIQWVTEAHRYELLKKIADIQISIPKNLYFENMETINITDKFFDSTVKLMKRLRADMYRITDKMPSDHEHLWTHFAKPFQSHGQTIHSLNTILIPFGAIDISHIMQSDNDFDYLTLATIGNLIAREIAHHFDENGLVYWNGAHDSTFASDRDEYSTYDGYINCHKYYLFEKPINMLLPALNKHISIMIPPTTVNERLSDVMGVTLAHETLARMESTPSKLLPWLDLDIHKLFYLAYAQTYCTKVPLTSSYVSLYENFIMPSRLKIFAAAINNKNLGELWKCREGSPVLPNFTCDVFPDLESENVPVASS